MRKVFLDDLPRKGTVIDWKNTIGHKVNFIYDDINGLIKILNYDKNLSIEYNNKLYIINTTNFKRAKFAKILGKITNDFKLEIGTELNDGKRNITIIGQVRRNIYKKILKGYQYHCNKCGHDDWIDEYNILKGVGCGCCAGKVVVKGINDIATTRPDIIKFLKNKEDAYKYTSNSTIKVDVICPICGTEKDRPMAINTLSTRGISCAICSDGVSYPEKFVLSMLQQLSIQYLTQLSATTFDWCGKYKYDFYLPDYNYILETHGGQHYSNGFFNTHITSLEDTQENDNQKYILAICNNISDYIIIDCRYSNLEYIKKSIMESSLPKLLSFTEKDINWLKCHECGINSVVKLVCDLKVKNEDYTTYDISKVLNLNQKSVTRYLKQGALLGWCNYNPKDALRKGAAKTQQIIKERKLKELRLSKKNI